MFTTAFIAFLCIGEIIVSDRSSSCIQLSQVTRLLNSGGSTVGFKITFRDFKHSYNCQSVQINLYHRLDTCHVQSLEEYITRRGFSEDPFFRTMDGHPVQRRHFDAILAKALKHCELDAPIYKGHSFRIGVFQTRKKE